MKVFTLHPFTVIVTSQRAKVQPGNRILNLDHEIGITFDSTFCATKQGSRLPRVQACSAKTRPSQIACTTRQPRSENESESSRPSQSQLSHSMGASCLSVSPERQGVVALPGLSATGLGLVVAVTLVETTGLLAGGGEAARLAVLVHGVDDPVDAGVDADGLVLGVDEDDLVVLVGRVLVDPVGVEDSEVSAAAADTLLGGGLEGSLVLQLVDTLVGGLAYLTTCVRY